MTAAETETGTGLAEATRRVTAIRRERDEERIRHERELARLDHELDAATEAQIDAVIAYLHALLRAFG